MSKLEKVKKNIDKEFNKKLTALLDQFGFILVAKPELIPDERGGYRIAASPMVTKKPGKIIKAK